MSTVREMFSGRVVKTDLSLHGENFLGKFSIKI